MPQSIKPKQKLKITWSDENDKITKIELNNDPNYFVELTDTFYAHINEKPFDMTKITTTDETELKQHMLFIGDLVQECIDQNTVPDKLIDLFRDLFWKLHKRVFGTIDD